MKRIEEKQTAYEAYCVVTEWVYKSLNAVCVVCLGVELFAVIVMVVGRAAFNSVPLWADQLSLMALVWMSMVTKEVRLSGFRVSKGLMYLPLLLCGIGSIYMCVFCIVRRLKEGKG